MMRSLVSINVPIMSSFSTSCKIPKDKNKQYYALMLT